jgi:hypothetical protein
MRFIYEPEGQEPQPFDLIPDDLPMREAELVEENGGEQWQTWGQWIYLINAGGIRAWRVALWIMLRRSNPTLELDAIQGKAGDIRVLAGEDEVVETAASEGERNAEPADDSTDSP